MKRNLLLLALFCVEAVYGQNPVFTHLYTADPSAHVWKGDNRLWLYTSHDEPGTNSHYTMSDYHVFSTTDLVNWVDYGRVLHFKDVSWAENHAWAIDAVQYRNKFYLVYCMKEKGSGIFRTGMAISDKPQGPFEDIGYIKGVDWGQDPSLFIDDDGKPYLFWGCGGKGYGAELNDDLMSIKSETMVELTSQLKDVFEGLWCHKYNGKYYMTYPGLPGGEWPEVMYYAIADKPLGPYEFQGEYIGKFDGQAGTNHGSVIKYGDKWLAFYHSSWLSEGNSTCRSVMMDYLEYDKDGKIKKIIPTEKGLGLAPKTNVTIWLEAENGRAAGGTLNRTYVDNYRKGFSGDGYVTGFDGKNDYVEVLAQVAKKGKYRLKVSYAAPLKDEKHNLLIGFRTEIKDIVFPQSSEFKELDLGIIELQEGDNEIRIYNGTGGLDIDYFKIEQL